MFGLLSLYWCISMLGIFDFDADVDFDVDADVSGDVAGLSGGLKSILHFVNASDMPVMLVLTFISGIGLALNVMLNSLFNASGNLLLALGLLIVNIIIAAVLTRYVTIPLKPLFKLLKKDEEVKVPIVGRVGIVKSGALDQEFGQALVPNELNSPTLLNCVLSERDEPLKKGDKILVIDYLKDSDKYVVCSLAEAKTELLERSPDFTPELNQEIQQQIKTEQYE